MCIFFITLGFSSLPSLHLQFLPFLELLSFLKDRNELYQGLYFTATFFIYKEFSVLETFHKIPQLFL